ncbi:MAG: hypothetical protein U9N51_06225, partial [Bacteroidota bacterium]|nr:hypothetical protein [Bacteroidota bacterium]
EIISNSNTNDVDKFFMIAEAQLHATVIYMVSNNELKGIRSFKNGFNAFQKLEDIAPEAIQTAKIRGLYNIFLGSVPEKYEWLIGVLGMEGDFELGVKNLKHAFEYTKTLGDRYEIGFYYAMFASFFTDNPEDYYHYFKNLDNSFYANPLMRQGLSMLAEASGNTNDCLQVLLTNYNKQGDTEYNLLNYQIGNFLLYKLNPDAGQYLKLYRKNKGSDTQNLSAERSLYWHYIITNQLKKAKEIRQSMILLAQNENNEQAAYIIRELESYNTPNIHLLKARLLYNGGDYQEALAQLIHYNKNTNNLRQNTEYHYRKANINEKLENMDAAKIYYKKTMLLGKDQSWYFAPQSALNLGKIHEAENKKDLAKQYYKMCIKINISPYKESINREAKRCLRQL